MVEGLDIGFDAFVAGFDIWVGRAVSVGFVEGYWFFGFVSKAILGVGSLLKDGYLGYSHSSTPSLDGFFTQGCMSQNKGCL